MRPQDAKPPLGLNPSSTCFSPTTPQVNGIITFSNSERTPGVTRPEQTDTSDLARYMARIECVNTILLKFDDHTENNRSGGGVTFKSEAQDLNTPPMQ